MPIMSEARSQIIKTKGANPAAPIASQFDLSVFDLSKMEVPAAFREISEKGAAQVKDTYEKAKAATEEATNILEDAYTTAARGVADYNLKVIEITLANTKAAFDYAQSLLGVRTLSEFVELSTAHAHSQFEAAAEQTMQLTELSQNVATETVEPLKTGLTKVFNKVAKEAYQAITTTGASTIQEDNLIQSESIAESLIGIARGGFHDLWDNLTKPEINPPGSRSVIFDRANPRTRNIEGHVHLVSSDGRTRDFKFTVYTIPEITIEFHDSWLAGPHESDKQNYLAERFRLLTTAFEKNLNPQIVLSSAEREKFKANG